jgi:hypothetical protein
LVHNASPCRRLARSCAPSALPPFSTVSSRFIHDLLRRFPPLKTVFTVSGKKILAVRECPARHFPTRAPTFATKPQGQNLLTYAPSATPAAPAVILAVIFGAFRAFRDPIPATKICRLH